MGYGFKYQSAFYNLMLNTSSKQYPFSQLIKAQLWKAPFSPVCVLRVWRVRPVGLTPGCYRLSTAGRLLSDRSNQPVRQPLSRPPRRRPPGGGGGAARTFPTRRRFPLQSNAGRASLSPRRARAKCIGPAAAALRQIGNVIILAQSAPASGRRRPVPTKSGHFA